MDISKLNEINFLVFTLSGIFSKYRFFNNCLGFSIFVSLFIFTLFSNPALLVILSQGSDLNAVQNCFPKVFDSLSNVDFKGSSIVRFKSVSPGMWCGTLMRVVWYFEEGCVVL